MSGVGVTALSGNRPSERGEAPAFTLQFTTLILIILTLIIGAFGVRRSSPVMPPAPASRGLDESSKDVTTVPAPSDTIFIEHLFRPASVEVDTAKALALAAVLNSHDIDAEIDVVPDSMGEEDYRLALRQASTLLNTLLDAGVPAAAFRVYLLDSTTPEWAAADASETTRVRLYRSGGRDADVR